MAHRITKFDWTESRVRALRDMYRLGAKFKDIQERFGVSHKQIRKAVAKFMVERDEEIREDNLWTIK